MKTTAERILAGLEKYQRIMTRLHLVDVSTDREFQRAYNGFYRLRQRSPEFYVCYYSFLEQQKYNCELTFSEVLAYLYAHTGRVEASFSSKLLATVRPEMPVWDAVVLGNLGLKAPYTYARNRMEKVIAVYDGLCAWYQTEEARKCTEEFDQLFPGIEISATKKADLVLWQRR